MRNPKLFLDTHETANPFDRRLAIFLAEYRKYKKKNSKPLNILDIGPGTKVELFKYIDSEDRYFACDYYKTIQTKIHRYVAIDLNEESILEKFKKTKFDVIFCGEVIEHLFSPDDLLRDIRSLMHSNSILILSTPNLSYYINRILLLFGLTPLFIENSSKVKLGRKFRFLGQGNVTEGHIRVFTYGALRELIKMNKYKIISVNPVSIWGFWPDKFMHLISKSFASDNVFILKK